MTRAKNLIAIKKDFISSLLIILSLIRFGYCQYEWTMRKTLSEGNTLFSVTYGNNQYVAVGLNGIILTSANGMDWINGDSFNTRNLSFVTFGDSLFAAVGANRIIITSTDGKAWTERFDFYSGLIYGLNSVTYGNNKFVAVGSSVCTSPTGTVWSEINVDPSLPPNYCVFQSVAYGNSEFVAVDYGDIWSSPNGTSWSKVVTVSPAFTCITYGNGKFVACEWEGYIWISSDGLNWTKINQDTNKNIFSVQYVNDLFFAIGDTSTLWISSEGTNWTMINKHNFSSQLRSIIYGNGLYVAVGDNGTILTSKESSINVTKPALI